MYWNSLSIMMIVKEFCQGDHQQLEEVELMTGTIHGKEHAKIKTPELRKPPKARQIPIHVQDQDQHIRVLIQADLVHTRVDLDPQELNINAILILIKVM